jgi:glycosyltransferase involved in cell wall biosynthesis
MISICIATYNGEKFIKEQLDSILCQIKDDDEIIISDDSSTDDTVSIIKSYDDDRIKLLENQTFYSPTFNFENALKVAQGDYIFLCDQDDVWVEDKIQKMIPYLEKYDLVVSDCKVVDEHLNIINESYFELIKSSPGFIKNFIRNGYLGCCMSFNKEILTYVLPFPKSIVMHDIWIGLWVELYGSTIFIDKQLILFRRHSQNTTDSAGKSKNTFIVKIKYRIVLLIELIKRGGKKRSIN